MSQVTLKSQKNCGCESSNDSIEETDKRNLHCLDLDKKNSVIHKCLNVLLDLNELLPVNDQKLVPLTTVNSHEHLPHSLLRCQPLDHCQKGEKRKLMMLVFVKPSIMNKRYSSWVAADYLDSISCKSSSVDLFTMDDTLSELTDDNKHTHILPDVGMLWKRDSIFDAPCNFYSCSTNKQTKHKLADEQKINEEAEGTILTKPTAIKVFPDFLNEDRSQVSNQTQNKIPPMIVTSTMFTVAGDFLYEKRIFNSNVFEVLLTPDIPLQSDLPDSHVFTDLVPNMRTTLSVLDMTIQRQGMLRLLHDDCDVMYSSEKEAQYFLNLKGRLLEPFDIITSLSLDPRSTHLSQSSYIHVFFNKCLSIQNRTLYQDKSKIPEHDVGNWEEVDDMTLPFRCKEISSWDEKVENISGSNCNSERETEDIISQNGLFTSVVNEKGFIFKLTGGAFIVTDYPSIPNVMNDHANGDANLTLASLNKESWNIPDQRKGHQSQADQFTIEDPKKFIRLFSDTAYHEQGMLPIQGWECNNNFEQKQKDVEDTLYDQRLLNFPQEVFVYPFTSLRHFFEGVARGEIHSHREEMVYEGIRLKSFHNVIIDASCIRLADAGFYATGDRDETRCFRCGVRYQGWKKGDIPFEVHCRISPDCPYVTGSDTSNIPIDPTATHSVRRADSMNSGAQGTISWLLDQNSSTENQGATSDLDPPEPTVPIKMINSSNSNTVTSHSYETDISPASNARSTTHDVSNLSFSDAVYPNYSDMKARIASFLTWPQGHCKKPAELVLVGFFYAGYGDCVRCFCCGIGLRSWEKEDDPWEEHVRWRSSCTYVKAVKGEEFITLALAGLARTSQQNVLNTTSGAANIGGGQERNDVSTILSRDVCKKALEMGFSAHIVRQHAGDMFRSQGTLRLDVLIEKLLTDQRIQEPNGSTGEQVSSTITRGQPGTTSELNSQHHTTNVPSASNEQTAERNLGSWKPQTGRHGSVASEASDQQTEQTQQLSKSDEPYVRVLQEGEDLDDEGYGDSNGMVDEPTDALRSLDSSDVHARNNSGNRQDMFNSMPVMSKSCHTSGKDTGVTLTTISEENREMRESGLCKICLDGTANIVFLPCGHLVACATCTPALERCPVCRMFIRGSVRVHLTGMASISHDASQE